MNKTLQIMLLGLFFQFSKTYASEIELSKEAIKNYEIEIKTFPRSKIQTLPRSALVASEDKYFIYEKDDKHFNEIEIKPQNITSENFVFEDEDFEKEKSFVVSGSKYLRIIFLNNNAPEEGHSH